MDKTYSNAVVYMIIVVLAATMTTLLTAFYVNMSVTLTIISLLLLTCLIAWRPTLGVYGMALCLPLINFNFNIGWMIIPLIDALAVVSLFGFGIYLVINLKEIENLKFPFLIPFLLFWIATAASAFVSPNIQSSLWYSIRWILFFYIVYIWFPVNVIKDRKILKIVLGTFVVSGLAMAIMGIISLKDQNLSYDPLRFTVLTIAGEKPFGLDQNLLVETLLPAIFFLLAFRFWLKKEGGQKVIMLSSLFLVFVLLGTFSRGAWISFFICLLIYIFYGKRASLKQVILVSAISLLLLSPLLIQMFRLQTAYDVGIGSTRTRWLSTQIAWSNFKESPLLGKGTGEYVDLVNKSIRFRAQHGEGTDSNGVLQKIMAENGLGGLLTFAFLMLYIFYNLYQRLKVKNVDFILLLPIAIGAFSIFMFEFFNTSYYHGKMWFPIAVAWAAVMMDKKDQYGK